MLAHELKVLRDIEHCRTAFFGGHILQCDHCGEKRYAYHSCRNRHCPKCHGQQTAAWLEKQQARLVPGAHYLLTFTLPSTLRPVAFASPKLVYGALLNSAATALLKLAGDPRYLGAKPWTLGVLHTWTRALLYHPHVHLLVSAGGLSPKGDQWMEAKNPAFLVPVRALSLIFRAKMRDALRRAQLLEHIPSQVWKEPWVVHCQHAGGGEKVLSYLARYVFRIGITNSRLESFQNGQVTFRYRDNRTQQLSHVTVCADEFIRRFLQHVLPPHLPKIRYYGLAAAPNRKQRERARALNTPGQTRPNPSEATHLFPAPQPSLDLPSCPRCHLGHLILLQTLSPQRKQPP